jgi:hypothetical protein
MAMQVLGILAGVVFSGVLVMFALTVLEKIWRSDGPELQRAKLRVGGTKNFRQGKMADAGTFGDKERTDGASVNRVTGKIRLQSTLSSITWRSILDR